MLIQSLRHLKSSQGLVSYLQQVLGQKTNTSSSLIVCMQCACLNLLKPCDELIFTCTTHHPFFREHKHTTDWNVRAESMNDCISRCQIIMALPDVPVIRIRHITGLKMSRNFSSSSLMDARMSSKIAGNSPVSCWTILLWFSKCLLCS